MECSRKYNYIWEASSRSLMCQIDSIRTSTIDAMVATQVLRVHRFDPASSTAKQKQIIQLDKSIAQKSLADVRKILIENHVFDSKE